MSRNETITFTPYISGARNPVQKVKQRHFFGTPANCHKKAWFNLAVMYMHVVMSWTKLKEPIAKYKTTDSNHMANLNWQTIYRVYYS